MWPAVRLRLVVPALPARRGRGCRMSRYRSDEATIWVWDEYDRTYVKWRSGTYWDDIRLSLREHFPQHGTLSYNATRKLWSVPLWQGARLEQWLSWTFEPSAVVWDEEPPASYGHTYNGSQSNYSRYGRRDTSTSTVEAAYAHLCLTPDAPPELV